MMSSEYLRYVDYAYAAAAIGLYQCMNSRSLFLYNVVS